jgi:hypothetical protein
MTPGAEIDVAQIKMALDQAYQYVVKVRTAATSTAPLVLRDSSIKRND